MERHEAFRPITAEPFHNSHGYVEILPCEPLRPYVRCFWGNSGEPSRADGQYAGSSLVTPDVCMDAIFMVDGSRHNVSSMFCGINDTYFKAQTADMEKSSVFAVRFYAWAAILFSQEDFKGTKNQFYDTGIHFGKLKKKLEPALLAKSSMGERVLAAEKILLGLLQPSRGDPLFLRAVDKMIESRGNLKILEMATDLHISDRQIERIFQKYTGCTPKKMAELIRYQYVWQDVCFHPGFHVLDGVHKYGYSDQAHLLHSFQNFHGMSLRQAKEYAAGAQ